MSRVRTKASKTEQWAIVLHKRDCPPVLIVPFKSHDAATAFCVYAPDIAFPLESVDTFHILQINQPMIRLTADDAHD